MAHALDLYVAGTGNELRRFSSSRGAPYADGADRKQAVGVVDGQTLDDHPAHRAAHDVCLSDAELVKDGDGVVSHVSE